MLIEDVISEFPIVSLDAIAIAYQPSEAVDWELVWINDAFCALFRGEQLDILGRHPDFIHHPDYLADFRQRVHELASLGEKNLTIGSRCRTDDGGEFWASVSFLVIPDDDGPGRHSVFNIRDIDDLKDREQAAELALIENEHLLSKVEAAQSRLISAIETTTDPFAIYDASDKLVIWNPAYAESLDLGGDRLRKGMRLAVILRLGAENGRFPDAEGRLDEWLVEQTEDWKTEGKAEYLLRTQDRDYKVIRAPTPNGDRVVLQSDISEYLKQQRELRRYAEQLESANDEISHQALHDELTGLGNRRYLNNKLEELIEIRRIAGGEVAALHIDLDRFKQINDTMGHAAGDYVLECVSACLKRGVRGNDVVARTGGDEFVVLATCNDGNDEPEKLAWRLLEDISKPVHFEGRLCRFGASIGIARTPLIEAEELLTSSDIALYKAKTEGRGRVAIFDHVDLEQLRASKRLGDDILRGLEKNEFIPAYQPQINPETGEIMTFEALARWQHPERGLLAPVDFLDTARELQVEGKIDKAIFEYAMRDCTKAFCGDDFVPNLSFNVCHARVTDQDLGREIAGWNYPGQITLELVETIFMEDESDVFHTSVAALRDQGIRLEVDDFGSGRASIVALRRLSPDRLKIDRRLVQPMDKSNSSRQLVKSIIDIGHALDIGVTAEGVETLDHVKALCQLGCSQLQGDYFARPMLLDGMKSYQANRSRSRAG